MTIVASPPTQISLDEIPYVEGFFASQSPAQLAYICARHGLLSPRFYGAYSWCEIGCGRGLTALTLAASNPNAQFTAIDPSKAALDIADVHREQTGLRNIQFIHGNVAEIDVPQQAPFDYITLHGIYSWVSDRDREGMLHFIERRLALGGIVYVSYNTTTGWAALAPLQHHYQRHVLRSVGPLKERAKHALSELQALRDARAPYFLKNPEAARYLRLLENAGPEYALHELSANDWHTFPFGEVEAEMEAIGLRYVGSADPVDEHPNHGVSPRVMPILARRDKTEFEEMRDFVNNRFFRRDVYAKDARTATHDAEGDFHLTTAGPPSSTVDSITGPTGEISLDPEKLRWLHRRLRTTSASVETLCKEAPFSENSAQTRDWLALLVSAEVLSPCTGAAHLPTEKTNHLSTFNRIALERGLRDRKQCVLAAPALGSAIVLNELDTLLLRTSLSSEPGETSPGTFGTDGNFLPASNEADGSEGAQDERIEKLLYAYKREWEPKLRQLGVLIDESAIEEERTDAGVQ